MNPAMWPAPGSLIAIVGLVGMLVSTVLCEPDSRWFRASSVVAVIGFVGMLVGLVAAIFVGGVSS